MSAEAKKKASVKPWRKSQTVLKYEVDPLIPLEYADVGNQRVVAISVWFALQAYKLYEVMWPMGQFHSNQFLVKFTTLDLIYLYVIPIFRIPLLSFNRSVLILLALVMSLINFILANNTFAPTAVLAALYKAYFEKELSLSGAKVKPGQVYQPSAHLKARYEVKILPESTACLNYDDENFCVILTIGHG
jgi:nucleoporin POM152